MRIILSLILTATFSLVVAGQTKNQTIKPHEKLLTEARAFQKELVEALRKGDRAALEAMIAEDFVFIHSTGPMETKAEYLANSAGGNLLLQRTEIENPEETWRVYEDRTVIRYARTVMRNNAANTENRMRNIAVFVKTRARGWQWVSGQSTRLPVRPKAATIDARLYEAYPGVYRINAERTFSVTEENGALYGLTTGRVKAELVPSSETTFVLFNENNDPGFMEAEFIRDSSGGAAAEVVLRLNGQEIWRAKKVK